MPRPCPNFLHYQLLALLAIFLISGCSGNTNDSNPNVSDLAKVLGSQINSLSELLIDPLSNNDPKAAEEALARFYLQCSQAGQAIENSVIVLDAKGVTFAARNPAPGHPEGVSTSASARDYSSYHIVRKAMKSGRIELGVVYLAQDKLYVVCRSVGKRKPVGVLVLGILGSYLEARIGVSGPEFLSMDIKS